MSGFQNKVNTLQAPAVGGDFASANPRVTEIGAPGQFVAPTAGILVGAFAWIDGSGNVSQPSVGTPATTAPNAFVGRQGQMSIWYSLLQQSGLTIPQGYPVTLYSQGDFWIPGTTTAATAGQKVFASTTVPGQVATGAAGATVTGYIETKWYVAAGFSCNAGELIKATSWGS